MVSGSSCFVSVVASIRRREDRADGAPEESPAGPGRAVAAGHPGFKTNTHYIIKDIAFQGLTP